MEERFDIIVFGATGFTGRHVLPYLHKLTPNYGNGLRWGIAGRSKNKLEQLLSETAELLAVDSLKSIPIIIADVSNEDSILEMTKKAKVIINCCGPYELYGEVVIKSCIETKTNYVDVTAESHFEELVELKYHSAAEKNGVYIINSCGYGSLYSELSLIFLENNFKGTIHSVEFFMDIQKLHNAQGPSLNYGTWESGVNAFGQLKSLFTLKRSRNLQPLPNLQPSYRSRLPFTKDSAIGIPSKRVFPVPLPDILVIKRSQRYFYENQGKTPYHVRHYYLMNSWKNDFLILCFGFIVILLSQCQCGRKLLLKHPKFFSAGLFDHETPSKEFIEDSILDVYFYGKGWSDSNAQDCTKVPINKGALGRIRIINPGYGFTCLAVTLSAILSITESSKLPAKGGVFTPAAAFSKTSIVEQFQQNGVPLEILSMKEL